jgi:hypothetical protein
MWISRQVVREYLVQVTRTQPYLASPLSAEEAEQHLAALFRIAIVGDDTAAVTDQLVSLLKRFPTGGKQVHDANIVATMLVNNISTLLTRNVEDMRRFEPLIMLVPLMVVSPPEAGPDSPETR